MFDWLIPLLIVVILLIKILDYLELLDILELVGAVLALIVSAAVILAKLLLRLVRHLGGLSTPEASSQQSPPPRGSGRFNLRSRLPSPGREHREDKG